MSSEGSSYFGNPPLNKHDEELMTGLFGSTKPPRRIVVPLDQPRTAAPGLIIGLSFAIVIVTLITGARLLTRIFRKGQIFGLDDWVIIPGALLALAYFSNILARTEIGCAGKHMNDCTYQGIATWAQLGGINQITFFASVTLIKISMCLFIRRITGISSRPWQITNNIFLGFLVIWFFITLFINIFQCTPVTAFFNFSIQVNTPTYSCLDTGKISNSFSIINCVTDFCLLAVPIFIIFRIQMPWGRKARLIGIFCIGMACCICSAYRSSLGHRRSKDLTYIFVSEVSWTIADVFFSAIVASLPALNALAEIAWAKAASSLGSVKSSGGGSSSGKSWGRIGESATREGRFGIEKLGGASVGGGEKEDRSNSQVRGLSRHGEVLGKGGVHGVTEEVGGKGEDGTRRYSMEVTDVEMGEFGAKEGY